MTFRKFIQTSNFDDSDIDAFVNWVSKSKFPLSNSPDAHVIFLSFHCNSMTSQQIIGYKKLMIAYFSYDNNLLKKPFKQSKQQLLDMINRI